MGDGNSTFHSSCNPASWSKAETTCRETNGTVFSISDLRTSSGGRALLTALGDNGELWVQNNWRNITNTTSGYDCATKVQGSSTFTPTNCSALHHYLCIFNDIWPGNGSQSAYFPCVQKSTTPSQFESSTMNQTSLEPASTQSSQSVMVVCVVVGMFVFAVAVVSAVIIKMRKRTSLHNTSSMNASLTTMSSVSEHDPDLQPASPLPMIFCTGSSSREDIYSAAVAQIQADYYTKIDDFTTDQQPSVILTPTTLTTAWVQGARACPSDRYISGESPNNYYEIQGDSSRNFTDFGRDRGEWRHSLLSTSGVYSEIDGDDTDIRHTHKEHYTYLQALHRASGASSLAQTNIYDVPDDPATDAHDRRQSPSEEYANPYAHSDDLITNLRLPESLDHKFKVHSVTGSSMPGCSPEPNHYDVPSNL